jgi:molybdopterin converting factor subunit 1
MRINVKLFAILRERAATPELVLHLRPDATVADASAQLAQKFPDLSAFLGRVAFAVNQSYAKPDAVLSEGDELAVIPPVSGGAGIG